MLRHEIKEFLLDIDGAVQSVTVPYTLCSAMQGKSYFETGEKCTVEKMKATAVFNIEEELKYTYIRLSGAHCASELFVNGVSVSKISDGSQRLLFDIADYVKIGENRLVIEFSNPEWDFGLLLPLELLRFNNAIIDDVRISQEFDENSVLLNVEITTLGSCENSRGVATLISSAGQIYYGGFSDGAAHIRISEPLFWYPLGLGVQNIYKLTVNLYGENEAEDTLEFKVGLCNVEAGEGALLSVNRLTLLPMGAVYIPERIYIPDESRKRTAAYITSAAMAGFNTFVIRGGRVPTDAFFDLCDVHGIAVIYETKKLDTATLKSIASVAHHPSFIHLDVVGCLDNDNATKKIKEILPGVDFSFENDIPEYFGEPSIPADRVTYSYILPEDRNVFSCEMEKHSGGSCRDMAASASQKYLYALSSSDFAYITRLTQAENTKREMLKCRSSLGKSGRAVFSEISKEMLISASSLDIDAGWKALQYYAKGFFAPVTVYAETWGTSVSLTAVNNRNVAVFGMIEYRVIDSENKVLYKYSEEIDIAENSSRTVLTHDLSEYISHCEKDRFIEYTFTEGTAVLAKGTGLFVAPKCFNYKSPKIKTEISGGDRRFSITVSAENYASGVEIGFENTDAVFSNNYFDITSRVPQKISFTVSSSDETVKSLEKQLKIRSIYDIGRN